MSYPYQLLCAPLLLTCIFCLLSITLSPSLFLLHMSYYHSSHILHLYFPFSIFSSSAAFFPFILLLHPSYPLNRKKRKKTQGEMTLSLPFRLWNATQAGMIHSDQKIRSRPVNSAGLGLHSIIFRFVFNYV